MLDAATMTPKPSTVTLIEEKTFETSIEDEDIDKGKLFGKYTFMGFRFQQPLKYFNIFFLGLFHAITIFGIITFPWIQKWKLAFFSILYGSTAGWGVTAGIHRCFTHRAFKATTPLKVLFLVCYAAAGHNRVFEWVRDHRVHHKFSETDADPHNSKRGFFFAHVGWLLMKKHPDVLEKGKTVDMSDIRNDRLLAWYDRNFIYVQLFFCFILPIWVVRHFFEETWYYTILTQVFGRYIIGINGTWLVNSAAHLFGSKPYDKSIQPRENAFVSFMAVGEGWHNYHHTFPWDYKASEYGKLNVTTFWIDLFAKAGLAYDLKYPSDELVKRTVQKLGDGSHERYAGFVRENGEIEYIKN